MNTRNKEHTESDGTKERGERRVSTAEKIIIFALAGVILVCIAFVAVYVTNIQGDGLPGSTAVRHEATVSYRHFQNQTFGSEDAAVEVIAVLPFEIHCHNPTIKHLHSAAESNPDCFRVRFFELHSPEGLYQLQEHDLAHCAAVIIDGSAFARLPDGSDAIFIGPVNDKYTIEELSRALEFTLANKKRAVAEQ